MANKLTSGTGPNRHSPRSGGCSEAPRRSRRLKGVWRDDNRGGQLVFDDTQMVISYVAEGLLQDQAVVDQLKEFLWRLGREADQGEVGIVVSGTYIGIVDFGEGGVR
jgi:hypothetical protein